MKKIKLALLKFISEKVNRNIIQLEAPTRVAIIAPDQHAYHSLSPIGDADPDGAYATALRWALENRGSQDIKNIAITGTYGSGKSTVLKTFQNHNQNPDLSFLNISLATFKEEREKAKEKGEDLNDGEMLRLIELSILQQIFYREADETIPDSRFKKIKSFDDTNISWLTAGIFLLILATIQLFNKTFLEDIIGHPFYELTNTIILILSLLIVISGYFLLIRKSLRLISSLTISKLNINNAEIEISKNINKSILNNHLDEILYFFEVTDYTVVVIEDLDRFEQTEIFTKLRELNLLINNSKNITRDIVFVYAVRDNMFKDKDRTKFFDFIIPIIPVINSSNSNEKLKDIIAKNHYPIGPDLIEDVSFFIDDMRLLFNITNEYHIYHNRLEKLDPGKLLAMIVYKNIYPNDFISLGMNEGVLHSAFAQKNNFIAKAIETLDQKIAELQKEVTSLEDLGVPRIAELNMMYVLKFIEKISNFNSFYINGSQVTPSKMAEVDQFKHLMDKTASASYYTRDYSTQFRYNSPSIINIEFSEIERLVDPVYSYEDRVELLGVGVKQKIKELKAEIAELERNKIEARHTKLKQVMALSEMQLEIKDPKQLQLTSILMRKGYIDEDYQDYISIFYEGTITKTDKEFLLNVKAQLFSDFDYPLDKIDKLVAKIDLVEFSYPVILNFQLLDFLLSDVAFEDQYNRVLKRIADGTPYSLDFVNKYLQNCADEATFFKQLAKVWPKMWQILSHKAHIKIETVELMDKVVSYCDVDDIRRLAHKSKLSAEIAQRADFLQIDVEESKHIEIIEALNIKFSNQNLYDSPPNLCGYIYDHAAYMLNEAMIREIMAAFGHYDEKKFKESNYSAILQSGCNKLIEYVDANMDVYLEQLYFKLDGNNLEEQEGFEKLINHENVPLEKKEEIIQQVKTKIKDLAKITDLDMAGFLLAEEKVEANWPSLINYFSRIENVLDPHLVSFINKHSQELSRVRIDNTNPIPDQKTIQAFCFALIRSNEILDAGYDLIMKSIPYYYSDLDIQGLNNAKVKTLVARKKLELTVKNFERLREDLSNLKVSLVEKSNKEFITGIDKYNLDNPLVTGIINSQAFTVEEKNAVLARAVTVQLDPSVELLEAIALQKIKLDQLIVDKESLIAIFDRKIISQENSIRLLIKVLNTFSYQETMRILSIMPAPYQGITIKGQTIEWTADPLFVQLMMQMRELEYIADYKPKKDKIKVITLPAE
ncbi:hypothetical protein OQX63_04925 [Pedobacter sp. PF22-3]|uniref:YobI family P-loop NTPase n=1 Tax=Pedobacter sp. PF22-3 TaxID=2994467 RepID=UPI0022464D99|nr:hypothetical protein [Pedobacter sp. PF22-3]MCX2492802.1 hypothetical protein [Pedobacter sp. PF22-3]